MLLGVRPLLLSQTLKLGIKQKRKKPSLQKLHQDITSWKSKIHEASSDRSKKTTRSQIITARVSTIINAAVEVVAGTPQVAECYVAVFLEDEDKVIKGLLCRGYIYDLNPVTGNGAMIAKEGDRLRIESQCSLAGVTLRVRGTQLRNQVIPGGWTGTDKSSTEGPGRKHFVSGANPATGIGLSQDTVPDNALWKFLGYRATVTTSAIAKNRLYSVFFPSNFASSADTILTASLTVTYNYGVGNTGIAARLVPLNHHGFIPPDAFGFPGQTIDQSITDIDAGDDMGIPQIYVEEWLIP